MHKYMYVETNISNMWTEILVRSVRNASLEKECKRLSRWIKFGCCNGAMFSQWSQPGSHSLLIVSTPTHEADGCVCVLPNEGQTRRNTQRRRINMHTPFAATPVSKMMFSLFPNMCLLSQPVDSAGKGIPSTSFLCSVCVFPLLSGDDGRPLSCRPGLQGPQPYHWRQEGQRQSGLPGGQATGDAAR